MIGYPSHPRSRSTNIKVGGIYSYKLSAGASWGVARRGGFVSIKGIEVLSYSTSALSFLSPRQRPTYISRLLLAPRSTIPFSAVLSCPIVHTLSHWGEHQIGRRIFHRQQASSPAHIQLASPEYFVFCFPRRNLVKHTKLPLITSLFYGF